MTDVISQYHQWKQQGEDLRAQARQAMEARFRGLLLEAVQLAQEYRNDFGAPLKPPPGIIAFRFRAGGKSRPRQAGKPKAPVKPDPAPRRAAPAAAKPDRKVAGMQKRLQTARQKLEAARAAGAPTRDLEDRIYEIEDTLRLAAQ
jgi:hypothetical protein